MQIFLKGCVLGHGEDTLICEFNDAHRSCNWNNLGRTVDGSFSCSLHECVFVSVLRSVFETVEKKPKQMKHIHTDSVKDNNVEITQTHDIKVVCMWTRPSSADLVDWLTYLGVTAWSLRVCTWICKKNVCVCVRTRMTCFFFFFKYTSSSTWWRSQWHDWCWHAGPCTYGREKVKRCMSWKQSGGD